MVRLGEIPVMENIRQLVSALVDFSLAFMGVSNP